MLTDEIRNRLVQAMKAKDETTKGIYRVALGEIQQAESSSGETLADDAVVAILRKLVKANEETLEAASREDQRTQLEHELTVLRDLLPKTLDVEQIVEALAPVLGAIREAKADGPAIGMAMRHLKSEGASVTGQEVAAAVREIRSGS